MTPNDLLDLFSTDLGDAWQRIVEVFFDPASDLQLALLVYAIASLLVIVVLIAVILVLSSADDEELPAEDFPADASHVPEGMPPVVEEPPVVARRSPLPRAASLAVSALVSVAAAGLVWFALGTATTQPSTCGGCHTQTPHNVENPQTTWMADDAHEKLACVDCHESPSRVGRYGLATVARTGHFLQGFGWIDSGEYGSTSSQACLNCHAEVMTTTIEDQAKAIRVSHREPLEAGSACSDCHRLANGVVPRDIGGMTRCVACHDGQTAPSECGYCHQKDVSVAASQPTPPRPETARPIIGTPDCGGCHDLEAQCDPCHSGVRLPHSPQFVAGGHAKEAVRDFWYGRGDTCEQCHTPTRRSCGTCHQGSFWSHGRQWAELHRSADPNDNSCDACHGQTIGKALNRNFCIDVCHTDREDWRAPR